MRTLSGESLFAAPCSTRVALVGMPGSGKSSVGRLLARRLGLPFVDTDQTIERQLKEPIAGFFRREGEAAFREVEQAVVTEACHGDAPGVLATGGGAVCREVNRVALHGSWVVLYLRSSPEELFKRLRRDTSRPLLQVQDPLAALRRLFKERDPLYRLTAHFVVETGRPNVQALVGTILMQLELAGLVDPARVPSIVDAASVPF